MPDKESKKRKRLSHALTTDSPTKRLAVSQASSDRNANTTSNATIAVTYTDDDALKPVLLSTPGINVPHISFQAYAKGTAGNGTNARVTPKTHQLLLHSSQHPRLDYSASTDTVEPSLSHYVAVYDPVTQRLQVTPAHHLRLQSSLRSELSDVEQLQRNYAQKREELGREFGTKKAKKAIASRTENAIIADTKDEGKVTDVQQAILESVGDATAGAASRNIQAEADAVLASKPIPRPDLTAERVEDVYAFTTLLPPADDRLVLVKDWQDKARADESIMFNHRFPSTRAAKIGKGDNALQLKALRYLTLLLEFHATLSTSRLGKKVPKKETLGKKLAAWPPQLVDSVRRRFSNDTGSELGKWQLDNLYTHVCALALYVDGWITDTSQLKDDLQMETRQLAQYFAELGCKVSALTEAERNARNMNKAAAAVVKTAKLKLPLEFPKPRTGRRK